MSGRWVGLLAVLLVALASATARPGVAPARLGGPAAEETVATVPVVVEFPAAAGGRVASTTEMTQIVAHAGSLWASSSQWMAPAPAGGATFRKRAAGAPWEVVLQSDQLRLMALDSFVVPAARNHGAETEVLLAQARVGAASELRWLVGPGDSFTDSFGLAPGADARALGAHDEGDRFAFYAGVRPTGVLRGEWDPDAATIAWSDAPELVVGGSAIDQKVTGFASCGGSAWVTVRTSLYRRVDGPLPPGGERWMLAYSDPEDNPQNSGLRGITCVGHAGTDALLVAREGTGEVLRFDELDVEPPSGLLAPPVLEVDAATLIGDTLRSWGHDVPLDGPGAVGYVIPAYNEWIDVGGGVHLTGVEWNYRLGACPTTRSCQPQRTFDAAACVLRRVTGPAADEPAWSMVCLGGEAQPAGVVDDPVQQGQAFVAVRAMRQAPWDLDELWFAGYDANFVPAVGTGWLAVGSRTDVVDPRSAAGPAPSRGPVLPPERPAPVPTAASPRFTG